jgi:DNA-binding transcriptional LysR family regulator
MELRHLRYFLAVSETSSFNKAAARLRISQPALSRQLRDLEEEIGVDLLRRSTRGVTLTPEGELFLEEVRVLLKHADDSVNKVRALARGEECELRVGYLAILTRDILPPGLAVFQKAMPRVKVLLQDRTTDEIIDGLHNSDLDLGLTIQPVGEQAAGIEFELLRTYPLCVAVAAGHPFARLEAVPLTELVGQPVVALNSKKFPEYPHYLANVFSPTGAVPKIAIECDRESSVLIEVEAGRGIAFVIPPFEGAASKHVACRRVTGTSMSLPIGIVRSAKGNVTAAAERFCKSVRDVVASQVTPMLLRAMK